MGCDMKKRVVSFILACTLTVGAMSYGTVFAKGNESNVEQKLLAIANGADDIYGIGAPIEENIQDPNVDPNVPAMAFISGGVDHTHQYIMANALVILNNDQGNSIYNSKANADILMSNTDWPDVLGNETDYGTYSGHFYDPDSEKNWLGQKSPTCKTRAMSYYDKAVTAYRNGNTQEAMKYLGRGTHYVSDVNEPHHASNLTAVNSNHSVFEEHVDRNRNNYKIINNTLPDSVYRTAENTSVQMLIRNAGWKGKALKEKILSSSTFAEAGEESVKNAITSVAQYLYKFAKEVGIY